jgi:hypothetical protein
MLFVCAKGTIEVEGMRGVLFDPRSTEDQAHWRIDPDLEIQAAHTFNGC